MADKTAAERAIEEPRRTAAESSFDVWSNYYFCPTLCRNCKYFSKENSNWPYHCKGPTQEAVSHKSRQEGYKQYDDCKVYAEKKGEQELYSSVKNIIYKNEEKAFKNHNASFNDDDISPSERRRLEREKREHDLEEQREREQEEEERRQMEEEEYTRTHCFSCGEKGLLVEFHGKYFHENCLKKFKESGSGKEWIKQQELDAAEAEIFLEKDNEIRIVVKKIEEKYRNIFGSHIYHVDEYRKYAGIKSFAEYRQALVNNANIEKFALHMENKYRKLKEEEEKRIQKVQAEKEQEEQEKIERNKQEKKSKKIRFIMKIIVYPMIGFVVAKALHLLLPLNDMLGDKADLIVTVGAAILLFILTGF
jgi:hypothetical protein